MDYEKAKADVARLVKACKTVVRQAEGGHAVGHDAVLELHRSLKATTPELKRPRLDERVILTAAWHALKSYEYGNSATELAKEMCEEIESAAEALGISLHA